MDTIITSDAEKQPESVRGLLEESRPLPPGVGFFEQRYTSAIFVKRVVIGLVLLLIGAVLILFSMEFLYEYGRHIDPKYREYFNIKEFLAGAAFVFASWLMVSSLPAGWALKRRQEAGERTRHGIFLTPEALVSRSQFDTTVIPRENFRGLNGGNVNYVLKEAGEPKSFTLPTDWVGGSPAQVEQAIAFWSQVVPPVPASSPPVPPVT